MTTRKFQTQFDEVAAAIALVLAARGRISGAYAQGTQLRLAPKVMIYCEIMSVNSVVEIGILR